MFNFKIVIKAEFKSSDKIAAKSFPCFGSQVPTLPDLLHETHFSFMMKT